MLSHDTLDLAHKTLHLLKSQGVMVATAESCTGGLIFSALTHHAGSSMVMDRGFVTYSNAAKRVQLNVSPNTLEKFGAVSEATVAEMLLGALHNSTADMAVAVSGVAGPGASNNKPQGLVYIGTQSRNNTPTILQNHFAGDRQQVREQTVTTALHMIQQNVILNI